MLRSGVSLVVSSPAAAFLPSSTFIIFHLPPRVEIQDEPTEERREGEEGRFISRSLHQLMDAIDEEAAPSMVERADDFRPYFPEKPDDDGFLTKVGLKKKLVKLGQGWEVPEKGDEITVHYTASVLDGPQFSSSKDMGEPLVEVIGQEHVLEGCTDGLITMRKGEISIFTVPPTISHGFRDLDRNIPLDVTLQVEVELISWLKIIDICGDGGILKKILVKSEILERAQKKDEVIVRYQVRLEDGRPVAKSPDDGVEFLVNDGHLCPAIAKTTITMRKGEKAMVQVQPEYAFGIQGRSAREGFCAVPPNGVIIIYLELLSYKILEYVTEDMKVVKKITTTGEGFLKPNSGTTAQIRYVGKLGDGRIFDEKGFVDEDPFEFKVDEEQVISGLDLAVATMKQGEFALVKIDPEYGFGDVQTKTDFAMVPPHSVLYYEVEMVKFTKVKESWDMEPEEKIEYAIKRKTEGNSYFKDGKYRRASLRYDMAAKYVEFDSLFNEEQKKMGKFFKVTCNLNNAACKLKLKDFREAAKLCTKVLHLEPRNVKALFRRAQAYIETMDLDLAEFDVQKALDIQPDNGEVSQLLDKVRKSQSYYDKKDFKTYANMFAKLTVSYPMGS